MLFNDKAQVELFEKLMVPLLVALISWFIKDYLMQSYSKRIDASRAEWKFRLTEVWSPLYYWIVAVLFEDNKKGWEKHGTKEIESILAKSAHVIPREHYDNMMKLLEGATDQKTQPIAREHLVQTREYVYGQVQIYNYLLYRMNKDFDPAEQTDILSQPKALFRLLSQFIIHLLVWVFLAAIVGLIYYAFLDEHYIAVGLIVLVLVSIVAYDFKRQKTLHAVVAKFSPGK